MATDVSTALPDLTLDSNATIEVDTGDVNAIITSLVVHVSQDAPQDVLDSIGAFQLVPGPAMGVN
jgi:hypothetical protein